MGSVRESCGSIPTVYEYWLRFTLDASRVASLCESLRGSSTKRPNARRLVRVQGHVTHPG